ncbi:hypothetical protein WR164_01680 [Philodulcilactobacillus myokoensis]|uniref:Xylulokinase n=1 Tax=Philodulcilactobacillus myokoensis TaxID=2929573 RepID=A0A9W6AYY2_9LACO|nr:FGGY family carbohydrate kinase [Philodulcilactobacillus myokoensis]GLB46189.1 hypothetical protein WR164_01680 [Philodulcilactobacillus myokoensis]
MAKYLIGIDIGTSSTKAILISSNGSIIDQEKASYQIKTPHYGWVEANANDWFEAAISLIRILATKVDAKDIVAIGIDGLYAGSGIPVDQSGKIIGPTLIWMDRRATHEAAEAETIVGNKELEKVSANIADPYYGFTKIMWIKKHHPDLYQKTAKFLPPESYIIRHLTGNLSMNYSAAGNLAGIFDIDHDKWSNSIAFKLGIDLKKLPQKFIQSTDPAGYLRDEWAKELGLKAGIPIFNTGVDVGPATVGTGVFKPGKITVAAGTSMSAAMVTDHPLRNHNLIIWPYAYKPTQYYYNFAGANTAGAIVTWFAKEFGIELTDKASINELNQHSLNVPIGSNGLIVLPYFMGERSPLWDSTVRGTILGISLKTTKYEIYNAFQEALAYAIRDGIDQFGAKPDGVITLVGGVSHSKKMVQMVADVTGKTVLTTKTGGEANLGSAILAGIGIHEVNAEDVSKWIKIDQKVSPNMKNHQLYNRYFEMYKKAYQSVKQYYKDFSSVIDKK